jgi:hypoxanthine phosphoribosyltransferase
MMKKRGSTSAPKKRVGPARRRTTSRPGIRVLYSDKQVRKRILELARQIDRDYRGKVLHAVGILEQCVMFMADLTRALKVPVICHFVRPEIRERSEGSLVFREIRYTPEIDARGKDVLLVDGILQSGVTLDHLVRSMLAQGPASVRTACLIEKTTERKVDVATDYVGFKTPAKFVVGYGLGHGGQFYNLPYVGQLRSGQIPARV